MMLSRQFLWIHHQPSVTNERTAQTENINGFLCLSQVRRLELGALSHCTWKSDVLEDSRVWIRGEIIWRSHLYGFHFDSENRGRNKKNHKSELFTVDNRVFQKVKLTFYADILRALNICQYPFKSFISFPLSKSVADLFTAATLSGQMW